MVTQSSDRRLSLDNLLDSEIVPIGVMPDLDNTSSKCLINMIPHRSIPWQE